MVEGIVAAVAVVSLGMSIYAVWSQKVANRKAFIEARWETADHGRPENRNRIVVLNHGPSLARCVDVQLTDSNGDPVSLRFDQPRAVPIAELNAGQDFYLPFIGSWGTDLATAELSWDDGRQTRQSARVWLTRRHVGI